MRAKGVNFRGVLDALERRGGPALRDRVLARVQGEAGEALRTGAVLSGGWYPTEWYDALLLGVEQEHPTERGVVQSLAREAVTHDLKTLFKLLSFVVSPESALTNATKIMARYWDGGRVSVREAREGRVHFVFEGYEGFTPRLWEDLQGGMEAVLDMLGVEREPFEARRGAAPGSHEVIARYRAKAKR